MFNIYGRNEIVVTTQNGSVLLVLLLDFKEQNRTWVISDKVIRDPLCFVAQAACKCCAKTLNGKELNLYSSLDGGE